MKQGDRAIIEWHLKKLDEAACGLMGVGMVLNAIIAEEGDADSKFPYKSNDFVGGALVSAIVVLAGEVAYKQEILSELLSEAA